MHDEVSYKPLDVKGQVQIELFDAVSKKKVHQSKTTNFISKGMKEVLMKMAMSNLFTRGKHTGKFTYNIYDPLEYMTLTTANHPEEPENEWFIRGKQIGYAYTDGTYSGDSKKRGTYNARLSYTTPEQVRIVVDFPTHAANGTFESIYFTYDGATLGTSGLKKMPFGSARYVQKHDNKYYVLWGGRLDIYDYQFNLLEKVDLPFSNYQDMHIKGEYIYFARDSSSNTITRAPLSNPTEYYVLDEGFEYSNYTGGITYDEQNQHFVVAVSSSYNKVSIRRYNNSWELLSVTDVENVSLREYDIPLTYSQRNILIGSRVLENNDTEANGTGTGKRVRGIFDNGFFSEGYLYPKVGFTSRALLDAPVTKTDNVTMTITYDFLLPEIY